MTRATAYQQFRDRLLSGELQPGQFVTQKELAQLAGVPIGTAREAIQKLEHEALLKVHPQRGIQVADVTTKFIREAFGLREALEVQGVRNFASGDFGIEIDMLLAATRDVLEDARANPTADTLERAVEVDWDMHDRIIGSLNNDLLNETYQINATRLRLIKVSNRFSPDRALTALAEHLDILELCKAQEAEGAAKALSHHIHTAMTRALQGQ
ncbi:transcriptional regulator, GntR family [Aliiroseovarius halocynthiae]|uniref:GntR family transcriptional regulator n=1 Tax=Aliiroseovarius halocynthiae TaxID=985055 RepID=A0A545SLJ8_9RHOB|nr:GntR family transcriptional regulator [Aliiroseovarius halocynthiae]TQV65706.1 GntR family transcriptional regulator [Aliiroseovarius halocynthiae]SMR83942.1 transcriptional regulator, GntR family [Aliiroseovarius halocynthiae]